MFATGSPPASSTDEYGVRDSFGQHASLPGRGVCGLVYDPHCNIPFPRITGAFLGTDLSSSHDEPTKFNPHNQANRRRPYTGSC